MTFNQTRLVYFSPTSTTKIILKQIANGIGQPLSSDIDVTNAETRSRPGITFSDELVILGAPVYGGRLPKDAAEYFKTLNADRCPAVLIVLYGNREFEDALLELRDICVDCGFTPLAAGAFIGEHSFTSDEFPIAVNRPDAADLEKADLLGNQIANLLKQFIKPEDIPGLDVPGDFPYKKGTYFGHFPFIDVTDDCDGCDLCLASCPKNAIDRENAYSTLDPCIYCCACIKACPQNARILKDSPIKEKAKWLAENCHQRKEPQIFLPG